ncbi:mono/diheme cytochrome c family protein [Bradyrhizobium sp. cir1]|nr:mono/diheme cytochrome c family protein [Bradyrhizobium sp. cir1]
MRILVAVVVLLGGVMSLSAAENAQLARGTAITDPGVLRKLDEHDVLTISRLLWPERSANFLLTTDLLFSWLPQLKEIPPAIDAEFDRYVAQQKAAWPTETIGVGEGVDVQLFDRAVLKSPNTRFVLAGIVNRMDRAYVSEESCGEIRLIYRLTRFDAGPDGTKTAVRLPMTFNLVLKARDERQIAPNGMPVTCAEVARRWLDNGDWQGLIGTGFYPHDAMLDRIETNIQISIAPKSALHDFRSDYLLKVFKYNATTKTFEESTLENQIDRDRILADNDLRRDFKEWLLAPENLREFDRGTVLIPEKFLARAAVVPTPAGLDASALQPEFGMMQGEGKGEGKDNPVFTDNDVVGALKRAAARGDLQNVRSVAGFQRRLNDVTCAGCHQTRGIGGFHFPGVDWLADRPSNSTIVPASPHFVGDQLRRRDILAAFAAGKNPDFSRGFASRPQTRGSGELAGTEYQDGWGAHCSLQNAGSGTRDESFTSWSCATGLTCQAAAASRHIGMCFIKTR